MNKAQGRRQTHHEKVTHKYEKQRARTALNKARHVKKAAVLKAAAGAKKVRPIIYERA